MDGGWIGKKCKIKRVGALRGRQREDCEKEGANLRGLCSKGRVEGGLEKKVQN